MQENILSHVWKKFCQLYNQLRLRASLRAGVIYFGKATNFLAVDYGLLIYDLDKSKPGRKALLIQARQTVVNATEIDKISKTFKAVIGKRDTMMVVCASKEFMCTFKY